MDGIQLAGMPVDAAFLSLTVEPGSSSGGCTLQIERLTVSDVQSPLVLATGNKFAGALHGALMVSATDAILPGAEVRSFQGKVFGPTVGAFVGGLVSSNFSTDPRMIGMCIVGTKIDGGKLVSTILGTR